jgi:hypothetical protein
MAPYLRIDLPETTGAPALSLMAPPQPALESRFWAALLEARVVPTASYVLHKSDCLIVRAKLLELDGSPVSPQRASQLLRDILSWLDCREEPADESPPAQEGVHVGAEKEPVAER